MMTDAQEAGLADATRDGQQARGDAVTRRAQERRQYADVPCLAQVLVQSSLRRRDLAVQLVHLALSKSARQLEVTKLRELDLSSRAALPIVASCECLAGPPREDCAPHPSYRRRRRRARC